MAKNKTIFACTECGNEYAKWQGKCNGCDNWNTLVEETKMTGKGVQGAKTIIRDGSKRPLYLHEVKEENFKGFSSGFGELDRVLGSNGIVTGSLVLIGGEPGKGKSTVLLQVCSNVSKAGRKVIYFSGEESEYQTKLRAERLNVHTENLMVLHTKDIEMIEQIVASEQPDLIVVDSIQTVGDPEIKSEPGSPSQVKTCTGRLVNIAKGKGVTTFIVGQVNKDAEIAGPKILEHMVDTVLYLEGEKYNDLRLLRAKKNRFGSANELGVFQMEQEGLVEIKNPSEFLLANRQSQASGSAVVCVSDTRPLLIEVQSLVSPPVVEHSIPRRTSEGFSRNRLNIIVAVLEKKLKVKLTYKDIYLNVVGGMEIDEPGADLGVAVSLYSSEKDLTVDAHTLIIGEIGLTGEVRPVGSIEQLVNEAEKVGFKTCILPKANYDRVKGKYSNITCKPVSTIDETIRLLFP